MNARWNPETEFVRQRRRLIQTASLLPLGLAVSSCGGRADAGSIDRKLQFVSLAQAIEEVERLSKAKTLRSAASWNWAQTLEHCAQSIEFSMAGFPTAKSEWFQRTVGAAAFSVFAWRGRMSHDLAEPIPGAPALSAGDDVTRALVRLRASIRNFEQWQASLKPHFAYGPLDKKQYDLAHAMHLANHLSGFDLAG